MMMRWAWRATPGFVERDRPPPPPRALPASSDCCRNRSRQCSRSRRRVDRRVNACRPPGPTGSSVAMRVPKWTLGCRPPSCPERFPEHRRDIDRQRLGCARRVPRDDVGCDNVLTLPLNHCDRARASPSTIQFWPLPALRDTARVWSRDPTPCHIRQDLDDEQRRRH